MENTIDLSRFAINQDVDDKDFKEAVYKKRLEIIKLAIGWEGSTPKDNLIIHNIWTYSKDPNYKVCLGKFGKEYYEYPEKYKNTPDEQIPNSERKNCNDMMPSVFKNGAIVDSFRARFDDIFALLEDLGHSGKTDAVRALSLLFYRNALLLDHEIINGNYSYHPNQDLVDYICASIPEYEGVPMEVYIHALDAIGFNEDVKYYTRELLQKKTGVGRENNMKTYSYAAACVLGNENWAGFVYKLMRGYGVAPITSKMFADFLPEANVTFKEGVKRTKKAKSEKITVVKFVTH